MPNPSVRSTTSATSAATTFTVNRPAGAVGGDILVAIQGTQLNGGAAPITPSGWDVVASFSFNTGLFQLQGFWKTLNPADGNYTFNNANGGAGGEAAAYLYCIQNASVSGPEASATRS